ncbi:sigma-54-dependent Fis family transcriptional regulator, partial [Bacteroidales bacterium OttesenSCG-928-A17]|nr:sigma-54-dependent Fis family transcriptional regulator [Bacteroidales bacterium OttesenSCG-928-A17]
VDIYRDVVNGNFRSDLLYRINTIEIQLPPLRERNEDIILLAKHFLEKFAHKYKRPTEGFSKGALEKLRNYSWPGNVRELQNVIERAVILSPQRILQDSNIILQSSEKKKKIENENLNLELLEREAIEKALQLSEGNMNKAAELLGISRYTLYRKMKKE